MLLLETPDEIGPATLAIVDQVPRVRTVRLDRITVGLTGSGEGPDRTITSHRPGLAVSPADRQVYVFGGPRRAGRRDRPPHAGRALLAAAAPRRRDEGARDRVGAHRCRAAGRADRPLRPRLRCRRLEAVRPHRRSEGLVEQADQTGNRPGSASAEAGCSRTATAGAGCASGSRRAGSVDAFQGRAVAGVHVVGPRAFVLFFGAKAAVLELGTGRVVRQSVPAHPLLGDGEADSRYPDRLSFPCRLA